MHILQAEALTTSISHCLFKNFWIMKTWMIEIVLLSRPKAHISLQGKDQAVLSKPIIKCLSAALGSLAMTQIYCVHSTYILSSESPLWDWGDMKSHHEHEAHAACCAVRNKNLCLWPRNSRLLSVSYETVKVTCYLVSKVKSQTLWGPWKCPYINSWNMQWLSDDGKLENWAETHPI